MAERKIYPQVDFRINNKFRLEDLNLPVSPAKLSITFDTWIRKEFDGKWYLIHVFHQQQLSNDPANLASFLNRMHCECYNVLMLHQYSGLKTLNGDDIEVLDEDQISESGRLKRMMIF